MQVSGVNIYNLNDRSWFKQWRPGQHLQVEVLSKNPSGEGIILLNGKEIDALLETTAEVGEKFTVTVNEVNDENLLLVRKLDDKSQELIVFNKGNTITNERGLPSLKIFESILTNFQEQTSEILNFINNKSLPLYLKDLNNTLFQNIPEWQTFLNNKGFELILSFFHTLGLDYESKLLQILKLEKEKKETELKSLKNNFKFRIFELIFDGNLTDEWRTLFEKILEELTGQQLWLKTGNWENAYVLLQFPIKNQNEIYNVRVAIESPRKGIKMDFQHCHLAIETKTETLGDIGVDIWILQGRINLRVLTRYSETLQYLIKELYDEAKEHFSQLGYILNGIDLGDLDQDSEFKSFVNGLRRSGVDLKT